MTPAQILLADLASRGIQLETDGSRLRWRPGFMVSGPALESIRQHKAELIALLLGPDRMERCPACRWPLDSRQRCPKCLDRLCVGCGSWSRSYFVERCIPCGFLFVLPQEQQEQPA
jgi:hypothetical protein